MPQPPLRVDALSIAPGESGARGIDRDPTTGYLRLTDPTAPSGLLLRDLASLSTLTGVYTVGRGGTGARYSTVSAALGAVPASASPSAPAVILVFPGVYSETIAWTRNGVTLFALGRVVLEASTDASTITFSATVPSTPVSARLVGVTIRNAYAGRSSVSILGGNGSTVAGSGIRFEGCTFESTGDGGYTVSASAVGKLAFVGCSSAGSSSTASLSLSQVLDLDVRDSDFPALEISYGESPPIPAGSTGAYKVSRSSFGPVLATLVSVPVLRFDSVRTGDCTLGGEGTVDFRNCELGGVTVNDTSSATIRRSTHGDLSGAGTIFEDRFRGSLAFTSSNEESVVFDVARPDENYSVFLDTGVNSPCRVTTRLATGFTLTFDSVLSTIVRWTVEG